MLMAKPIYLNPDYEGFVPGTTSLQLQKLTPLHLYNAVPSLLIACLLVLCAVGACALTALLSVELIKLAENADKSDIGTVLTVGLALIAVLFLALRGIIYLRLPKGKPLSEQNSIVLDGRMIALWKRRNNEAPDGRPLSLTLEYQFENPEGKTQNGRVIVYDDELIARAVRLFDPNYNPVVEISVKILYFNSKTHMLL